MPASPAIRRQGDWRGSTGLDGDVRILIVALGGTTACTVCRPRSSSQLAQIIQTQLRGITVLLAGMEALNYGPGRSSRFKSYPALTAATSRSCRFCHGVAGDEALNQRDGIHPRPPASSCDGCGRSWPIASRRQPPHDRTARRVENRHEWRRAADHPSPAVDSDSARTVRRHRYPRGGKSTLLGLIAGLGAPSLDRSDRRRRHAKLGEDALAKLRARRSASSLVLYLIPSQPRAGVAVPMEIAGVADARPRAGSCSRK